MILYQGSCFVVCYADYYLYSLVDRFLAKIAFFVIINSVTCIYSRWRQTMNAISVRLPDELKDKAMRLAKKKNMSFNSLVNYWLQAAVQQDETIEWMKSRLSGKNPDLVIAKFGDFLQKTQPGDEPTIDEIQQAMER